MKLLLDMNMTPQFVEFLRAEGFDVLHWAMVGDARDPDETIMAYAVAHQYIVITRDLDFSAILSASGEQRPSIVQLRAQVTMPAEFGALLVLALRQKAQELKRGAVVTVTTAKIRVRLLPFPEND